MTHGGAEPAAPTTRLYPIGRLDADSTGLLLMTNDGELTNRLLHPRYKVEKEYRVRFDGGPLSATERERFTRGLELDDGPTAPCHLTPTGPGECLVVLREGRKRQIKRMFTVLGRRVTDLHRVRFGPIRLRNLPPGQARPLAPDEMQALLAAAGLEPTETSSAAPSAPPGGRPAMSVSRTVRGPNGTPPEGRPLCRHGGRRETPASRAPRKPSAPPRK